MVEEERRDFYLKIRSKVVAEKNCRVQGERDLGVADEKERRLGIDRWCLGNIVDTVGASPWPSCPARTLASRCWSEVLTGNNSLISLLQMETPSPESLCLPYPILGGKPQPVAQGYKKPGVLASRWDQISGSIHALESPVKSVWN